MKHIVPVGGLFVDISEIQTLTPFRNPRTIAGKLVYDYEAVLNTGETVTIPQKEGYTIEKHLKRTQR
jgi:hypothetical protein